MDYKIKKISEVNNDLLKHFYKLAFPLRYKTLINHWKWSYKIGQSDFEPLVLEHDSKIIGMAGLIPEKLRFETSMHQGIWFTDFHILESYRNKGLGSFLTKEWMKICPNQMAMCSPYSLRVLKKFGWNFNFETKRLIRPINYLKFVPILNKLNLNLFNNMLRFIIKRKFNDQIKLKPFRLIDNFKVISDSFSKKKFPENVEGYPIIDRNESWLHWRLKECPYRQNLYFFEYKNSFSIVHIYFIKKIKRLNVLFTYHTDSSEELKLYELIINWALNNEIDYVWAVHRDQSFKNIFPKIHNRPLRFASWSNEKMISNILQNGFYDLQGIDSDIESGFFVE